MNLKPDFMWRITPSPSRGEWVPPESPVEPEEDDRKKLTRKSRVSDVNSSESQSRSPPRKCRSRRKHTYTSLSEESDSYESESDSSPTPTRRKATRRRRRKKHKLSRRSKKKVLPPIIEMDVGLIEVKKLEITQKKPVVENESLAGPLMLLRTEGHLSYGRTLRPAEGDAIAQYVQQGKPIPRIGEVGLSTNEISKFESLGYVMSGSKHQKVECYPYQEREPVGIK